MTDQPKTTDEPEQLDQQIEDLDVDPKDAADIKGAVRVSTGKVISKAVLY